MICPRCSIGEVAEDTRECVLCGFSMQKRVTLGKPVVDEVQETVQRELQGKFEINVLLRHGTRSVVYLAREIGRERLVVLKVIPIQRGLNPDFARFARQADIASSLSHSHIVPVLDFGRTNALLWYSMEFVEGRSLFDRSRDSGPIDLESCQRVLEQVASGLDYMHRRGVTHGNLKPTNILVEAEGWTRVSDACVMSAFPQIPGRGGRHMVMGTPEYMAPEQFRARAVGPSADQYSLAVVAFEALCGTLPFVCDSFDEIALMHQVEPPPRLTDVSNDVPVHVSEAIRQAMSKSPAKRFPTVLDFVAMLRHDWTPKASASQLTAVPEAKGAPIIAVVPEGKPRPSFLVAAGSVVGVVAVMIILFSVLRGPPEIDTSSEPVVTATQPTRRVQTPPTQLDPATPDPASQTGVSRQPADQAPQRPTAGPVDQTTRTPPRAQPRVVPQRPAVVQTQRPLGAIGYAFINSSPWGQVYVDDLLIGNTPRVAVPLQAGLHVIRIVRAGFETYERQVIVAPGQELRLTDITLKARQQ